MRMNVSGLCGVLGLLLGGAAQAGVERLPEKTTEGARPDEARRAVLAMKTACSVPVMSRVYRPRPDCPPRRAAVLKLGDRAVVALRAELVESVAQRAAEALRTQHRGALPLPKAAQGLMRFAAKVMTTTAHRI